LGERVTFTGGIRAPPASACCVFRVIPGGVAGKEFFSSGREDAAVWERYSAEGGQVT